MDRGRSTALNFAAVQQLFKYQSGRVIALGRAILAALFLLSIVLDQSQPAQAVEQTYAVLLIYVIFAAVIAAATWNDWWRDARLAAPAHLVDMAVFTVIVFSTNGYTSPFFLFFALPLLSAAIRWGWRETALTAAALVLLYFVAGVLSASGAQFELQRFVARTTHLVILSAMLIWFGIHQRGAALTLRLEDFDSAVTDESDPAEVALRLAMDETRAGRGMLLLGPGPDGPFAGPMIDGAGIARRTVNRRLLSETSVRPALLFDCARDRTLGRSRTRRHRFGRASVMLDKVASEQLDLSGGVIARVRTGAVEGWLVLEGIEELSTDYIEVGAELGRAAGVLIDRSALLGAIEENAGARARLTLARDVHDSIVQFLAGATFRVEAINRASRNGEDIEDELQELKHLLVDEQRDIRGFISAVRRERVLGLHETADELRSLAVRLSQQWGIACSVAVDGGETPIPLRMQIDLQQLIREAVANAVRHGAATKVDVRLTADEEALRLNVQDNGRGFTLSADGKPPPQPWSLKERVDRAKGSLMLISDNNRTRVAITLPLSGGAA